MKKNNIPTHDPQTGELNPHYEELTGKKNPLESISNKRSIKEKIDPEQTPEDLEALKDTLNYWKERYDEDIKRYSDELSPEIVRIKWNIKDIEERIAHYDDSKVSNKVFLIDIDGTVSEDIKNEDSHLYASAKVLPGSREMLNKWYYEGNTITFFTAREEKDRGVTEKWLSDNGFQYHGLVMDKPRIKDGQEYFWIDNRKVRAVTYLGTWGELKEVDAKIQTFG